VCKGKRYNRDTLQIDYKGKNIADVLNLTVEEGYEFFKNLPALSNKLKTLLDVGLGYIRLGQSATTLSGGESQRLKLSAELSRRSTGRTFYILDEPSTGLHFEDVRKLLVVLHSLVAQGNTVLVIEHNLDIIKNSDWVVDLGPEGGEAGGRIIAQGTVQQVADAKGSYTGEWLRKLAETEKAFPHARQPRVKTGQAIPPVLPSNGTGRAAVAAAKRDSDASAGAPEIPDVFRRKPDADEDPPKKRGRPPKTVRV
jgi:excinuclease ABC subunit A